MEQQVFLKGDTVLFKGQKCIVYRRNSMTTSYGAIHRYDLQREDGAGFISEVDGSEVFAYVENEGH